MDRRQARTKDGIARRSQRSGRWALVAGVALAVGLVPASSMARPGDLDPAFSKDGLAHYSLNGHLGVPPVPTGVESFVDVSIQVAPIGYEPGGDVIIGGRTSYGWNCTRLGCFAGRKYLALARVRPDGTLDPGFGDGGVVEDDLGLQDESSSQYQFLPGPIAVQGDGRIVAAITVSISGQQHLRLARFLPDGSLDPSFSDDGISAPVALPGSFIKAIVVQEDGRILVGGDALGTESDPEHILLVRLLADGTPDPSFDADGVRTADFSSYDQLDALAVDGEGRILTAGRGETADHRYLAVARFLPSGELDPAFSGDGYSATDLLPDNNPFVAGFDVSGDRPVVLAYKYSDDGLALVRLTASGEPDPSFGTDGVQHLPGLSRAGPPESSSLVAQSDGRLLIGGGWYRTMWLGRRLGDGAPDPSFGTDGLAVQYLRAGASTPSNLISRDGYAVLGAPSFASPPRAQLARFRLGEGPPDDADADRVPDPTDRCPGIYAPEGLREAQRKGCPPPFSLRVTLGALKGGRIGGEISGETVNCVTEMAIFRKRRGHDRQVGRVLTTNMGIPGSGFPPSFEGGWSVARTGLLRRGGPLYVRARSHFDPSVGYCEGDRSKTVDVPGE